MFSVKCEHVYILQSDTLLQGFRAQKHTRLQSSIPVRQPLKLYVSWALNYWLYKSNCMNKSEAKCSSCHYIHIVKQTDNNAVRIGYLDRFPPCSTWVVCFCKIACSAGCVSMDVLFFSSTLLLQVFMSEWTSVVSAEERQVSLLELNEKSLALSLF